MELEKTLLRKVGEAIHRFRMIRDGDRVAVALSGGKDSATMLEALLLLQKRAPIDFSVRGVDWTYFRDAASLRLLDEQPGHGCDLCSRYRRRAVYEIARDLGANVIAFGHTADDFCEALLRNAMFTGRLSALPAVSHSRKRDYRLIRPLVFVTEDITRAYAESKCGCSQRTGTVRRALRDLVGNLERDHPHLKENLLSAMGNIDPSRLLDPRFLDLDTVESPAPELFPIVAE
jgi:tRNA 2-thiocytidine biosynthesis protein TtcA